MTIARSYGLAIDHLCFANGWPTNATEIWPDTPVTIPSARILPQEHPRDGMVVNLPERMLYRFQNGRFKQALPCSIGHPKRSPTPRFRASIREKLKDPVWYPPEWAREKSPVPPGPGNPLGDRWLGLSYGRYGIHSTYDSENVGNDVTHGCIRLFPEDLRELFPQVRVGEKVFVVYETVVVGVEPSGRRVLSSFPDVYGWSPPVSRARQLLSRWGLPFSQRLADEIKKCKGLPIAMGDPVVKE